MAPKCPVPKQSATSGAETENSVPKENPTTAARSAQDVRSFAQGRTKYARPAARKARLIILVRPILSE